MCRNTKYILSYALKIFKQAGPGMFAPYLSHLTTFLHAEDKMQKTPF